MNARVEYIKLIRKLSQPLTPVATNHPLRLQSITVKSVIFDIYGTLLISAAGDTGSDTVTVSERAFTRALADGGWNQTDISLLASGGIHLLQYEIEQAQQKQREQGNLFSEIDILQVWRRVLDTLQLSTNNRHRLKKLAISYECRTNPTWPMPGMLETLTTFRQRGMQLGIISNAQFYTPIIFETLANSPMKELGLAPDLTLYSYQEMIAKPSPLLFDCLNSRLSLLGIRPDEVLYIGNDMIKDIIPANRAGWRTALFAGDKRSLRLHENSKQATTIHADLIINDLRQLLHNSTS